MVVRTMKHSRFLQLGSGTAPKPHPHPYIHRFQDISKAWQTIAAWEVKLLNMKDSSFTFVFDIDINETLVVGVNILE